MNDLELAAAVAAATNERNRDLLAELMSDDVVLQGPFPLGTKRGPAKAAKTLVQMSKLGVKLTSPASVDGTTTSQVQSPAGAMVLTFSFVDGKVSRLDVAPPA